MERQRPFHRATSETPRVVSSSELVAWRFDLGEESYALLEWPRPGAADCVWGALSPAERQVARLVAEGLTNAAIARRRGSSVRTVANQVASVFRKLGVGSRLELGALVARGGSHPAEGPP